MKPLLVLLGIFLSGWLIRTLLRRDGIRNPFLGRIAMSGMLFFTGIAHFPFAQGMMEMLPDWMPFRIQAVYFMGVIEILAGVGLLIHRFSRITGISLIIFLLLVLPANIYAAIHHIDPVTGASDGPGISYLFFRVPLQLFFILWVYLSAVKPNLWNRTSEPINHKKYVK